MQKKRGWIWLALFLCLLLPARSVCAEEAEAGQDVNIEEEIGNILADLDLSGLEEIYDPDTFGGSSLEDALNQLATEGFSEYTVEQVLNGILDELFGQAGAFGGAVAQIVLMLLVTGILSRMRSSFQNANVAQASFRAGYIVVSSIGAAMLASCIVQASQALDSLSMMVENITPVLMALLTGIGGLSTSSVLSPALAALTGGIFSAMRSIIFPAVIVTAVITIASNISSSIKLGRFTALIESGVKWFLGIVMIVFVGVIAIKGITGASLDGLSFKTAKYTIDKVVPVVGGMFSDTLDTLMACGLIVKNAVGIVGLVTIAAAMLSPIAMLTVNTFMLKFTAAIAEPFADGSYVAMLGSMSNTVTLLLVVLLTATAMAFISIGILMGTMDMTMAVR